MNYKVGDRVRIVGIICKNSTGNTSNKSTKLIGKDAVIIEIVHPSSKFCYHLDIGNNEDFSDEELKLTKNITTMKLGNMMKRLLDADTQTLVKVGYINGDLKLTEKGSEALQVLVFTDRKDDLVKLAQEELDEEKNNA